MTNTDLARLAVRLGRQRPPRTPERRVFAAVYAALSTTKSTSSAMRALATFTTPEVGRAAVLLLGQLARGAG